MMDRASASRGLLTGAALLLIGLSLPSCSVERVEAGATAERDGRLYAHASGQPYTGIVVTRLDGSDQVQREDRYRDGIRQGRAMMYHPDGTRAVEASYGGGRLDGKRTEWYETGARQREEWFVAGERHGVVREWAESGQQVLERSMKSGVADGLARTWYPSGARKAESTYGNGSLEGEYLEWYENGQQKIQRSYRDGYAHGPASEWYENGQLMSEASWKAGEPDGAYTRWHPNGRKAAEGTYRSGGPFELRLWDETGRPLPGVESPPSGRDGS